MNRSRVSIVADLKNNVSGGLSKIRDDFDRLGKTEGAKTLLKGAGLGAGISAWGMLSSAVSAAGDFLGDSIRAASDMNETVSKGRVVFGESAGAIERWGRTAAQTMGMSTQQALAAAAGFGEFFQGAGQSADAASRMSMRLVQLAADLASFDNLDPADVLAKLKSGLSGEAEPLRAVGVFLNEAAVQSKAAEMGLGNLNGELTDGEKILARYQLILEQTTKAQGDFARTADQNANSHRREAAELENAKAELGKQGQAWDLWVTRVQIATLKGGAGITAISDGLAILTGQETSYQREARGSAEATAAQAAELVAGGRAAVKADDYLDGLGKTTRKFVAPSKEYAGAWERISAAVKGATGPFRELEDALYGPQIRAGELAQAQKDLAQILKDGPESRKSQDLAIYAGKVAEARQRVLELQAQEAQAAGPQAMLDWVHRQEAALGKADDKARAYLATLGLLAALSLHPTETDERLARGLPISGKRAAGGPVTAGGTYLVGENGPELLQMGSGSGTVIPNGRVAGGRSGAPVTLQINLDGRQIARVVDRHLAYELLTAPPRY